MKTCFKCKSAVGSEKIGFRDECPQCGSDLHVCVNCSFYDTGKSNSCREEQADYVKDRERANYCEYFRFGDKTPKAPAREQAEQLFAELFKKRS